MNVGKYLLLKGYFKGEYRGYSHYPFNDMDDLNMLIKEFERKKTLHCLNGWNDDGDKAFYLADKIKVVVVLIDIDYKENVRLEKEYLGTFVYNDIDKWFISGFNIE